MTSTLDSPGVATKRNGSSRTTRFDLEPPAVSQRRSRWPELSVGLAVIGFFALIAAWFYSSSSDSVSVLALRSPVERGDVIESSDLMIVDISSEGRVSALGSEMVGTVVGNVALTDLSVGTLLTGDLFADRAAIASGEGVVGLALSPGEFPTLSLRPGDLVRVVETPRQADDAAGQTVLVEVGEVVDVRPIGVQGQLFVSLSVSTTEADAVSAAASQGRVRLIQVGED